MLRRCVFISVHLSVCLQACMHVCMHAGTDGFEHLFVDVHELPTVAKLMAQRAQGDIIYIYTHRLYKSAF